MIKYSAISINILREIFNSSLNFHFPFVLIYVYYASPAEGKPEYKPALERCSLYKTIWTRHWFEFKRIDPRRFEKIYGPLSEDKADEVIKLIQCGEFKNGFQYHTCPDCGSVLVVPFGQRVI